MCFDEDQLEQVCEYPSENSMLDRNERLQGEEACEDEGEGGEVVFKSMKSGEIAAETRLRVGQCHPLLRKHSV